LTPINKMSIALDSFEKGNLSTQIDLNSHDELGKMASMFNQMATTIKESYENLELNISQRTKELQNEITQHKKTEAHLLQTAAELRKAQQVSHVGSWIWNIKNDHLEWSDEMYNIFDINKEAFDGKLDDVINQRIHPDDKAEVERLNQAVMADSNPIPAEYRIIWRDGTVRTVWAEAGELILDESDKPAILTGIVQDITDRKQAEEALDKYEQDFKMLVENAPDIIFRFDNALRHVYVNSAVEKATGVPSHEFIGKTHEELGMPEESVTLFQTHIRDVFESGHTVEFQFSFPTPNGEEYYESLYVPEFALDKTVKTVLGVSRNITKRIKAENQIKSALKEKETLLHEIHHRVKNNMQVISSLLDLQSSNNKNKVVKNALRESQSRICAMAAVHETLHDSDSLSEIDLQTYLSKVTASVFQTYSVNPGKVILINEVKSIPINIKQAYPLGLIINELISNSMKYAFPDDKKGTVTVGMKKLDSEFELKVMDDGIGMPEAFDWQSSNSLGLTLIRSLAEDQLDGRVQMESDNGTKFTIKFNIEA
jgi:PAS domain S-box-containing protein